MHARIEVTSSVVSSVGGAEPVSLASMALVTSSLSSQRVCRGKILGIRMESGSVVHDGVDIACRWHSTIP
jgi:hypothetical protein